MTKRSSSRHASMAMTAGRFGGAESLLSQVSSGRRHEPAGSGVTQETFDFKYLKFLAS